jgi:sensor domain CHASE-containing protein
MNKSVSSIERQVNSNILTVKELIEDLMKDVRLNANNAGKTKRDELNNKEQLKLLKKIQTQLNILKTEITNVYNIKTNNTKSTTQDTLF